MTVDMETAWIAIGTTAQTERYWTCHQREGGESRSPNDHLPITRDSLESVTQVLASNIGQGLQRIRIDRVAPAIISACSNNPTLVLFGLNLWRNPKIFMDGEPAAAVEVLPDMGGVAARFDVGTLARATGHSKVQITIVTQQATTTPKSRSLITIGSIRMHDRRGEDRGHGRSDFPRLWEYAHVIRSDIASARKSRSLERRDTGSKRLLKRRLGKGDIDIIDLQNNKVGGKVTPDAKIKTLSNGPSRSRPPTSAHIQFWN